MLLPGLYYLQVIGSTTFLKFSEAEYRQQAQGGAQGHHLDAELAVNCLSSNKYKATTTNGYLMDTDTDTGCNWNC
ncbi:hypothetical protein HMPREF1544_11806 [Mucor circinelloides 1006PhL]|uniref:Uncharacterized protein n=1 Tax=Mucor circinelloides f. circinelloides (strain 1006PhL) TaxID=1220926 RepID=S2IUZ9_MUCC1|nr:hypothetical protein HMPREF1544_11806 [Mucor circinelloides 1006PhL]